MQIYDQYLENKNLDQLVLNVLKLDDSTKNEALNFLEKKLKKVEFMKLKVKLQSKDHIDSLNLEKKEVNSVVNTQKIEKLQLDLIKPNPNQPRKEFKDEEMLLLANSIYKNGLINPILVYKNEDNDYVLVAGQLRLASYKYLNEKYPGENFNEIEIKISPIENPSESFLLLLAIEENTHRNELDVYQTANSYTKLLELKEKEQDKKISIRDFSEMVNISKSMLHDYIKISNLKEENPFLYNCFKDNNITSRAAIIKIINADLSNEEKEELIKNYSNNKLTVREIDSNKDTLQEEQKTSSTEDIKHEEEVEEKDNEENDIKSNLPEKIKGEKVVLGIGQLSEYLGISEEDLSNEDDKKIELMLLGLKVILKSKKD